MPSSRCAVAQRAARPLITVSNGTPRAVCVCGSKKISAWTHVVGGGAARGRPSSGRRSRSRCSSTLRAGVVDVEEALQVGEGVGRAQRLDVGVRQRDAVASAPARRSARARACPRCAGAARPWASRAAARAAAGAGCGRSREPSCARSFAAQDYGRAPRASSLLLAARHLALDALDEEVDAAEELVVGVRPAASISLPSLLVIGPFQIAKLPSFRPALTVVELGLDLGGHLVGDRDEVDRAFLDAPPGVPAPFQVPSSASWMALM